MDSKHHDISSSHKPSHVIQNVQDINNEMNTAKVRVSDHQRDKIALEKFLFLFNKVLLAIVTSY